MPRQVRIEYEGALYHVMARGNRRNRIFASPDGGDEVLLLKTLGECCERSGFRVWAWVLMGNHYHLLVETPSANLVAGMAWLQNTYTRRFNSRHREWGRLFGDRYKSVLIESGGSGGDLYLRTLLDYIHLNPVRARIVPSESYGGLLDYPWSSLAKAFAVAPKAREPWMAVTDGLALFQCGDRAADRRHFVERLEERMKAEAAETCGLSEIQGQTLQSTLRKGWYWGSESFKESLLEKLEGLKGSELPVAKDFRSSDQARDHAHRDGEKIIAEAVGHFALSGGGSTDFMALPRGDLRRVAVAWALCRRTSLRQSWIAERLGLRSGDNVSAQVRKLSARSSKELSREIRAWMKKFQ
ncbi:MAG: transposase [Verrucomicrobiales bacterium]|nr:transposase [Verrucomicrobiales bacterium]